MTSAPGQKEPCKEQTRTKARALRSPYISRQKFPFSAFLFLSIEGVEVFREEILHLDCFRLAFEVRHEHRNVAAKFPDQRAASAAGWREYIGIRHHGNGIEAALSFADGFENGDALGANSEA